MPFESTCTGCNKAIQIPDGTAGKKMRCGECGTIQQIVARSDGSLILAAVAGGDQVLDAPQHQMMGVSPAQGQPVGPPPGFGQPSQPPAPGSPQPGVVVPHSARAGARPRRRARQSATGIFVWGILGVVLCAFIAPVALLQGNAYMAECRQNRVQPDGLAVAGRILGIIGTIILALGLIYGVLGIAALT